MRLSSCDATACVALQELLKEPVIAADGHTYEKHAFLDWLEQHATSPVTGQALSSTAMTPNLAIMEVVKISSLSQNGAQTSPCMAHPL